MQATRIKTFEHPGLILDTDDLAAIRLKIDDHKWAKSAYDSLLARVDAITEIHVDDRKGSVDALLCVRRRRHLA
jgi:hypothetical protein